MPEATTLATTSPTSPALAEGGPGSTRVAAVLLGLGPEAAGSLFRLLAEPELRMVAAGAKGLRRQPPATVPQALKAFIDAMEALGGDTAASDHLLRDAAVKALGADAARRAFDGDAPQPPADEVL